MSHWNYRLVRMTETSGEYSENFLVLTEAYYDDEGRPDGLIGEGARFMGEDIEEVRQSLLRALESLDKPILDESDFTRSTKTSGKKSN